MSHEPIFRIPNVWYLGASNPFIILLLFLRNSINIIFFMNILAQLVPKLISSAKVNIKEIKPITGYPLGRFLFILPLVQV